MKITLRKHQRDAITAINNAFEEYDKCAILFINQELQSVELLDRLAELKRMQETGDFSTPKIKIDTKVMETG